MALRIRGRAALRPQPMLMRCRIRICKRASKRLLDARPHRVITQGSIKAGAAGAFLSQTPRRVGTPGRLHCGKRAIERPASKIARIAIRRSVLVGRNAQQLACLPTSGQVRSPGRATALPSTFTPRRDQRRKGINVGIFWLVSIL